MEQRQRQIEKTDREIDDLVYKLYGFTEGERKIIEKETERRKKMKEYNYIIILEREEDGGYHVFCPALPGCHTQGDTFDEAMENIKDAIKLYIESLKAHQEPIPEEDITIKPLKVIV